MKGRIIGFNPCLYFSADSDRETAGVVIEVDRGNRKDTVVTYSISRQAVNFPEVNQASAMMGNYLYDEEVQDQLKVEFELRNISSRTYIVCAANINTASFEMAVKNNEVFVTCLRKIQ